VHAQDKSITDAIAAVMDVTPFYAHVLYGLKVMRVKRPGTAGTDGLRIMLFNNWDKWSAEEQAGVMLHECMHVVYKHCTREFVRNRRPRLLNAACDYYINLQIAALGDRLALPLGVLLDEKYTNWEIDDIYVDLLVNQPPEMEMPEFDEHDFADLTESEREQLRDIVRKAAYAAGQDNVPGEVLEMLPLTTPDPERITWRTVFSEVLGEVLRSEDYSYARPNNRSQGDVLLPVLANPGVGQVVVAVDSSGSINREQLRAFMSESAHILSHVESVRVVVCDTEVHQDEAVYDAQVLCDFVPRGGGGTDFCPVFEAVPMCEFMVFFTDSYGTFPDQAPPYPVLWVLWDERGSVPWGRSVVLGAGE